MKTNKFTGYCSLYNVNYYDIFIVMPHAFDSCDTKRVPVLKNNYYFLDPDSVIGYATLSMENNIGVMATCILNNDIEIDNIVLDAHVADVIYAEDSNTKPKHVTSGIIRCIMLNQKEGIPYHECVTAVKEEK